MAISFVANALGGTATTTDFSITLPATVAGDIILLEYCHRGTADATLGGTYTGPAFGEWVDLGFGIGFSGHAWWSRATGDHAGQTVTGSGLTNSCAAIITIYRGCIESGDPSDGSSVAEQNSSGDETNAAITTATDGAMVILTVVNSPDLAVTSQAAANIATFTAKAERLSTGGTDTSIAHASGTLATAGSSGAFTWAQTNAASGSWAYSLKPGTPTLVVADASHGHTVESPAVAPPSPVGTNSGTGLTATGVAPSNIAAGNQVLAFVTSSSASATITPPSGWTLKQAGDTAVDFTPYVYELTSTGGWTGSEGLDWVFSVSVNWRVDMVNVENLRVTNSSQYIASATNDVVNAVTPPGDDETVVTYSAVDATGAARTWTNTGTATELVDSMLVELHVQITTRVISGGAGVSQSITSTVTGTAQDVAGFALSLAAAGTTLVVADASHAHTADAVVLTQVHNLTVADAVHANTADNAVLTQVHNLAGLSDAVHSHTVDAVTLTQVHVLTVADAAHASTADAVVLTQVHNLAVSDAVHAHTADNAVLTQDHTLAGLSDAVHAHTVESANVTVSVDLTVADSSHAHEADSATLTQAHNLTVADSSHANTADSVVLTQVHNITVADAEHGHTSDNAVLTQLHVLAVADALHGHTSDNAVLTQVHTLALADTSHAHLVDDVTLGTADTLSLSDARHSHTSENVALTQLHLLAVDDASHANTVDAAPLTQAHNLAGLADVSHANTVDTTTLTQVHVLTVSDTSHAHTVDPVTLSEQSTLTIGDASHAHTVDSTTLTQLHILTVADALHAHIVESATLTQTYILTVEEVFHSHTVDGVIFPPLTFGPDRVVKLNGRRRTVRLGSRAPIVLAGRRSIRLRS